MSKVDALEKFPHLGRVVPEEKDENIREIIFPPYRIIYQVLSKQSVIAISRIWHGARGQPEIPNRLEF
jgi:plasmid stabilization system protein ParE